MDCCNMLYLGCPPAFGSWCQIYGQFCALLSSTCYILFHVLHWFPGAVQDAGNDL